MSTNAITIGKLRDQTGVKIETIRYYEKIGLMPEPPRSSGGQRIYERAHLSRLRFIKRSRDLGFSLSSVRELLNLQDERRSCGKVQEITLAHLAAVREKISDLKRLEQVLHSISKDCIGGDAPACPIIEALSSPARQNVGKI